MPWLFSYGTLQHAEVQLSTFGRRLHGEADTLRGYSTTTVVSNGAEHANAVPLDGAVLAGTALPMSDDELGQADAYEAPDGYARTEVTLASGRRAWLYVFSGVLVRTARADDLIVLTEIWFEGWHDAHDAIVPDALVALRTRENFLGRLRGEPRGVRVVVDAGTPVGFAMLRGAEVYQFYVARSARGTGAAAILMRDTENHLSRSGIPDAWLACAVGNVSAARFYEKCGWIRTATVTIESENSEGSFPIQTWRYEKRLR